jgi:ABC-type sugar transport system permease subunit
MERQEARLAWLLVLPALAIIVLIALVPLLWALWESFHLHDLRMPWRGQPWVGPANYMEALAEARFWQAAGHTAFFIVISVTLELALGLVLALILHRSYRGRGAIRAAALVPWVMPTVVAALVWRFLFESPSGVVNMLATELGFMEQPFVWFIHATAAWVPLVLADVWKTTPFVALLLLAGLQSIDTTLYEAARIDGASPWRQFLYVTLPLLRPALLVALIFRTLDAVRVFDLVYILTGGGPGTATEPLAFYTFHVLFQRLRFGYGAALSVMIFLLTFALALVYIRVLGKELVRPGT